MINLHFAIIIEIPFRKKRDFFCDVRPECSISKEPQDLVFDPWSVALSTISFSFFFKKKKKDAVSITARNEVRMITTNRFLAFTDLKDFRLPVDHRKTIFFSVFYRGTDKKLEHDSYLLFKSSFHIDLVFFI